MHGMQPKKEEACNTLELARIQEIQEWRARPQEEKNQALSEAAENNDVEQVKILLAAGAQANATNKDNYSILYLARTKNLAEVVNLLEEQVKRDSELLHASATGNLEAVKTLLGTGANVNSINECRCYGPLHWASIKGHLEVVQTLLAAGAMVNTQGQNRRTPLHFAAEKGHLEVVQALLGANAGVNATSQHRNTPLHYACYFNHLEVVQALLDFGANANTRDNAGCTPMQYASLNNHTAVANLLRTYGATE